MTPEQWEAHQAQMKMIYAATLVAGNIHKDESKFDAFIEYFVEIGEL